MGRVFFATLSSTVEPHEILQVKQILEKKNMPWREMKGQVFRNDSYYGTPSATEKTSYLFTYTDIF